MTQIRRQVRRRKESSTGQVRGLYLKSERGSEVQFEPMFLSDVGPEHACIRLDKTLDRLYASHDIKQVQWYIERSHGLDVNGKIAWGNIDITDQVVP
ncbi:hypothetical protein Rfer_4454 (plasmid) [Rhodoferax ferrireducens T118]|uniref:Uncharacterized protein n=1 Tax=Albidiferax ferrireducens (strain ATCC BAA-621 / DSM 15236 / T118) TaxID=338969 RepID=Q21Q05_ALBFT|nr:hypothetical protein Rfer_4454 [Rhodoferax ferrireducens T118]